MNTISLSEHSLEAVVAECSKIINANGVVLLPTETVYGLVCKWDNPTARDRIYELKQRDTNKLLSMFVANKIAAKNFGAILNQQSEALFDTFTPGAITIVTPCSNGGSLGIRIPDHPLLEKLLDALDFPLASTSANLSGTPAALSVAMAMSTLNGTPDLIVDGGNLPPDSLASTVVSTLDEEVKVLRSGAISSEQIENVVKCIDTL